MGQTSRSVEQRWTAHRHLLMNGLHTNRGLLTLYKTHGLEAFVWKVVQDGIPLNLLDSLEHQAILAIPASLRVNLTTTLPNHQAGRDRIAQKALELRQNTSWFVNDEGPFSSQELEDRFHISPETALKIAKNSLRGFGRRIRVVRKQAPQS